MFQKKTKTFEVYQRVPWHQIVFVKNDALGISVPQQLNLILRLFFFFVRGLRAEGEA